MSKKIYAKSERTHPECVGFCCSNADLLEAPTTQWPGGMGLQLQLGWSWGTNGWFWRVKVSVYHHSHTLLKCWPKMRRSLWCPCWTLLWIHILSQWHVDDHTFALILPRKLPPMLPPWYDLPALILKHIISCISSTRHHARPLQVLLHC